jgi:hypothetical protein
MKKNKIIIALFSLLLIVGANSASASTEYTQTLNDVAVNTGGGDYRIQQGGSWTGALDNGITLILSSATGADVSLGFTPSCCLGLGGWVVSTNTVHVTGKNAYTFTFSGRTDINNPYGWNAYILNTPSDLVVYGTSGASAFWVNTATTYIPPVVVVTSSVHGFKFLPTTETENTGANELLASVGTATGATVDDLTPVIAIIAGIILGFIAVRFLVGTLKKAK